MNNSKNLVGQLLPVPRTQHLFNKQWEQPRKTRQHRPQILYSQRQFVTFPSLLQLWYITVHGHLKHLSRYLICPYCFWHSGEQKHYLNGLLPLSAVLLVGHLLMTKALDVFTPKLHITGTPVISNSVSVFHIFKKRNTLPLLREQLYFLSSLLPCSFINTLIVYLHPHVSGISIFFSSEDKLIKYACHIK